MCIRAPIPAAMALTGICNRTVRLSYKPYFFSQRIIFFSHNKSVNSHGLSAKRTGQMKLDTVFKSAVTLASQVQCNCIARASCICVVCFGQMLHLASANKKKILPVEERRKCGVAMANCRTQGSKLQRTICHERTGQQSFAASGTGAQPKLNHFCSLPADRCSSATLRWQQNTGARTK